MSRGLGKVQKRILRALTEVSELHGNVYVLLKSLALQDSRPKVDRSSAMESTRRAVRTLEALEYVETRVVESTPVRMHKVVRLRKKGQRPDLPRELDSLLFTKLEIDDALHNERLRHYGSRWRRLHVSRPYLELATVFDLQDRRSYEGVYLYPAESAASASEERLDSSGQQKLLEELDREAGEKIEREVQRRVNEELERRGEKPCACSQERPAVEISPERAPELLIELLTSLSEAFADAICRDSLLNRGASVEALRSGD